MKIVEYDQADPLDVLHLNLLSLGYALTPERVAFSRQLDPRPFPFFALYAIEDGTVAGQVGVYRLPMVTIDGPEDVGGICAMCTHPGFARRGLASRLMEEAHARMRSAGLRFSTLGTARYRAAYALYQRQGYETVFVPSEAFARRENVLRPTGLRAECAGSEKLSITDDIFQQAASGRLGFARRQKDFLSMLTATGDLNAENVWLLWSGNEPVGYAIAQLSESILKISNLLLIKDIDAAEALSALAHAVNFSYLQLRVDDPFVARDLQRAGYAVQGPDWSVFMIKPLTPDATAEDARRLFGIGKEAFLISWMDVT